MVLNTNMTYLRTKNMIKSVYTLTLILLLFSACQSDEEITHAEAVIEKFYLYDKSDDYKGIDTLMTFQFYQGTPYIDFISILKKKKEAFGSFKSKTLEDYKITYSKVNTIFLEYKVSYYKKQTKESFILEDSKNGYKIFKYNIDN